MLHHRTLCKWTPWQHDTVVLIQILSVRTKKSQSSKTVLIPCNININTNPFTYYWTEFYHYRIKAMQNDNMQCVWAQDTFTSSCCLCTLLPQQQWLIFPEIGCHIWSLCHFLFFHYTHNRWKILSCLYSMIRFGRKCHSLIKQRET